MITITGKVEDTTGSPRHVLVTFSSLSTPLVGAGVVTGNSESSVRTLVDGTFEIDLKAGNYQVIYSDVNILTRFNVTLLPEDDGTTQSIEDVVSSPMAFVETAPNTVWNGTRAGHITFDPIDAPTAPTCTIVAYAGGEGNTGTGNPTYAWTHVTQDGETDIGTATTVGSDPTAEQAVRVTSAVSPTRVTSKILWRLCGSSNPTWEKVATVVPSVAYYDDWEDEASIVARSDSSRPPDYNTTAGKVFAEAGSESLYFSTAGILCVAEVTFNQVATFKTNAVIKTTGYLYFRDPLDVNVGIISCDGSGNMQVDADSQVTFNVGGLALILADGKVKIVNSGEGAGKVLTSDADGFASWATPTGGLAGSGTPEGSQVASPGATYLNTADESFWVKKTGTATNTGWIQLIA